MKVPLTVTLILSCLMIAIAPSVLAQSSGDDSTSGASELTYYTTGVTVYEGGLQYFFSDPIQALSPIVLDAGVINDFGTDGGSVDNTSWTLPPPSQGGQTLLGAAGSDGGQSGVFGFSDSNTTVPEPSVLALGALSGVVLFWQTRRRANRRAA
jgi:hypothetical protein